MCIPSPDSRKRKNTSEEPEQETPPTHSPPPPTSNADASPPPPPPPPPPPRPPPLAPAEDDIAQQLPDEDLFDTLSPLDFTPDPISPQPLNMILPSSSLPHSPSKDWSSSSWISKYATPTPLGTYFLPTSEDELIIRRNIDMFFHSIDDEPDLIPMVTVDTFFPDETSQHATKPTSPSAKMVGAGIANLGNTCFMSAILQCFTHTVPLVQGLRSCTHATPCGADGFCVVCALREHIDASLASSGGHVVPRKLVDNLSNFSSNFRRYQQEDAHEFMQCALNKLRRCFPGGEDNLVEKVFGGRLISKLRCCNCGHSSDTYEPLIDLSLEMENVNTLQHALESFTKVEKIDEKFTCASCMEDVSMEKQLMLYQTPPVVAFHLKRFKKDGTTVKKINNHVHFTMELDLQLYTSGNRNDNVLLNYDLYAVVVHVGSSPNSGHYFCFARSAPDKWHKLNDSEVTSVLVDLVLCQEAYILFYARQGTPWFSSIMEGEKPDPKSVSDTVEKNEQKLDCSGGESDDDPMEGENPDPKSVSDNVEKDEQKLDCSGGECDDDPMEGEKPDPKSVSDNVEKDEQKPDCFGGKSEDDPMDAYNDSADVSGEESDTAHTQVSP